MRLRYAFISLALIGFHPSAWAADGWQVGALTVRNQASVPTFKQDADLTYNPQVATSLSLSPRYGFSDTTTLGLTFGLSREWTRADSQSSPNEVWLSDPIVSLNYALWAPEIGWLTMTALTAIRAPISPTSRAASNITRIDQGVTTVVKRGSMDLSYTIRGSKFFHEYTTGQLESPRLGACQGAECFQFMHTGVRNTSWAHSQLLNLGYSPTSRLRFSALGGIGLSFLYPLASLPGLPDEEGTDVRYATLTQVSAQLSIVQGWTVRTGVENFYAQLRPDGTQQTFFLNRYANVFVDVVVSDALFETPSKGNK